MQKGHEIATGDAPEPGKKEKRLYIGKFNQYCYNKTQFQGILWVTLGDGGWEDGG